MPRLLRRRPSEATVMPFPTDETTPPLTKMYLATCASFRMVIRSGSGRLLPGLPPHGTHRLRGGHWVGEGPGASDEPGSGREKERGETTRSPKKRTAR